ncbi:Orotidine 5'-phosphate decarboxylase [hydrothermal vent metagenome]|uniref:Orotidine 5'-phosphate decarboxylase n=1 Tax=hydrothermal vent metagenome TaxID=652676 RepID=A0A3B0WTT1_9ZZZZ
MKQSSPVIVALDFSSEKETMRLVDQLEPALCKLKVGKELFTRCGPVLVKKLVDKNFDVFLDLKYHDIPNTVAKACVSAAELGVWMLNVHALGGEKMMAMAKQALESNNSSDSPLLIAVTWLTSSGQAELDALGINSTPQEMVSRLATMTQNSGLDGVVCSAQEAPMLRQNMNEDFLLVTPGIRPADASQDDQCRIVTPAKAMQDGSSYLVIGRPITQADNPYEALNTIVNSL